MSQKALSLTIETYYVKVKHVVITAAEGNDDKWETSNNANVFSRKITEYFYMAEVNREINTGP